MEGENGMQEWFASLVYKSGTQGWYTEILQKTYKAFFWRDVICLTAFPPLSNDFIPFIT